MYKILKALFILLILVSITSCEEDVMTKDIVLDAADYNISDIEISKIAQRKIFFGHQSVGFNILDGIANLMERNSDTSLNIVKSRDPGIFTDYVFAHSPIGENSDPELKIADFEKTLNSGIGNKVDTAFLKLCFLDINKTTDIESVFAVYSDTINRLKTKYPRTKFVHFTVPLTVSEFSIRSFIKKLIGRHDNNVMRNQFNDKLLKEYLGKDPVFDIAKIESTYPDGSRSSFSEGEKSYYSLVPEYAADSGHLNEIGGIVVARELLTFLSNTEINRE